MKKIRLMIVMMILTATVSAQAQKYDYEKKHEVAVTYGALSNSDWINVFEEAITTSIGARYGNDHYTGPVSMEYFYRTSRVVSVGGIFAYGTLKQDIYLFDTGNGKDGVCKNIYFTVMPSVKFDWLRSKNFGLYTKLGAGLTLRSEKINYTDANDEDFDEFAVHPNWQLSVLGVEAGSPNLRAFTEVGVGEQGIFVFGVRARF